MTNAEEENLRRWERRLRPLRPLLTLRGFTAAVWLIGLYLFVVNCLAVFRLRREGPDYTTALARSHHPRQLGRSSGAGRSPQKSGDVTRHGDASSPCDALRNLEARTSQVAADTSGTSVVVLSTVWGLDSQAAEQAGGWNLVLPALRTNLQNPSVSATWVFSPKLKCSLNGAINSGKSRLRIVLLEQQPSFATMLEVVFNQSGEVTHTGGAVPGVSIGHRAVILSRADMHWPRSFACLDTEPLQHGRGALAVSCHANARSCMQPSPLSNDSSALVSEDEWRASYWGCRDRERNPAHCVRYLDHCYKFNKLHHAALLALPLQERVIDALRGVEAVFGAEASAVGALRGPILSWHNPCRELGAVCERCAALPELHELRFKTAAATFPIEPGPLPQRMLNVSPNCASAHIAEKASYTPPNQPVAGRPLGSNVDAQRTIRAESSENTQRSPDLQRARNTGDLVGVQKSDHTGALSSESAHPSPKDRLGKLGEASTDSPHQVLKEKRSNEERRDETKKHTTEKHAKEKQTKSPSQPASTSSSGSPPDSSSSPPSTSRSNHVQSASAPPPTSAVMTILRHEPLPPETAERFALLRKAWASLCDAGVEGRGGSSRGDGRGGADGCANATFQLRSYVSMPLALQAYSAFHAAFSVRDDAPLLVFRPNQYGLGNRLRSLKSALLLAMLTGRVFRVDWSEPFPLEALVKVEAIDWRHRAGAQRGAAAQGTEVLCLPFGAGASQGGDCSRHLSLLQSADLREAYRAPVLEVSVFTDLHIYLSKNAHYKDLLASLGTQCPKRMGCLYRYLFSPQPVVQRALAAVLAGEDAAAAVRAFSTHSAAALASPPPPPPPHVAVQVRNRLWRLESSKLKGESNAPTRVVQCMARWVPNSTAAVFFTADEDSLYPAADHVFGARLRTFQGRVYAPWSMGARVDSASLGEKEELAVIKAIVDWFALQSASLLVYTFGSSFGKTAAEASDAPNVDVNHTRCRNDEITGGEHTVPSATYVTYDTRRVPGA